MTCPTHPILLLLLLAPPLFAAPSPPASAPTFDPGVHAKAITSLAVVPGNDELLTGSEDGTVRLWDTRGNTFQHTLTIGSPVRALALLPGGQLLVATTAELLVVGFRSGEVRGRLPLQAVDLAVDARSGRAAAALATGEVVLLRRDAGGGVQEDRRLPGPASAVVFGPAGQLLCAGAVGLQRYDGPGASPREAALPASSAPAALRLAPDGLRFALSDPGRGVVEVRRLGDLGLVRELGVRPLGPVIWAQGALQVPVAGPGGTELRSFEQRDLAPGETVRLGPDPVSALGMLPPMWGVKHSRPRLVFATAAPSWALLEEGSDEPSQGFAALPLDWRGVGLRSDANGAFVELSVPLPAPPGLQPGRRVSCFAAARAELLPGPCGKRAGGRPMVELPAATGCRERPTLEGALKSGERLCSEAAAGPLRVLGTNGALHLIRGGEVRSIETNVPALRVGLLDGGRLLLAAFEDGTLRYYATDAPVGEELIASVFALLPELRNEPAVYAAWLPQGYYAASPSAARLLGWSLGGGQDALPALFPASELRGAAGDRALERPAAVSAALLSRSATRALAALELPAVPDLALLRPLMQVLRPRPPLDDKGNPGPVLANRPTLDTAIALRGVPGSPADLSVLKQGVPDDKATAALSAQGRATIELPQERNIVLVFQARTKPGAPSQHRIAVSRTDLREESRGVLRVLSVGIDVYQKNVYSTTNAVKDAELVASAFGDQKGQLYTKVITRVLPNEKAKLDDVLAALRWLREDTRPNDSVVIFLDGHGRVSDEQYEYLPHDADLDAPPGQRRTLDGATLRRALQDVPGRVLLLLNTCYSGGISGPRSMEARVLEREFSATAGRFMALTSAQRNQTTGTSRKAEAGLFATAVAEGVRGKAALADGSVRFSGLLAHLSERLPEEQSPAPFIPQSLPDEVIARVPRTAAGRWWWQTGRTPRFWGPMAAAILVAGVVLTAVCVSEERYDRGNTGWLVNPDGLPESWPRCRRP